MVVPQQAAESLVALDLTILPANFITRCDDLVVEALVISFLVIMLQELADSGAKHLLAEEDHFQETLFLEASHETFDVRRQIGRPWR